MSQWGATLRLGMKSIVVDLGLQDAVRTVVEHKVKKKKAQSCFSVFLIHRN